MFEFHNLGALAAGAVLIGGFQLGGHTGLDPEPEPRMDSAKFVITQGRHATTPALNPVGGLSRFATPPDTETGFFEKAMVVFDRVQGQAMDLTHSAVSRLID